MNNLIEIVYDNRKKKLRARSIQDGRWIRFPNKLRTLNKVYIAENLTSGRGDSWIASGKIEELIIKKNERSEFLENLLNLKNKLILKLFYENLFSVSKMNTEMLNIVFLVKKILPNVDEQLLQPLLKQYDHQAFIVDELVLPLKNLLSSYNEKRIIQLFSNYCEDDFIEDTTIMYERLLENDVTIDQVLPDKPKNIVEIHTILTRECSKIKEPNNKLKQNLPHLENKMFENCEIFIPQTAHELIDIGNTLSICVGNGYYAEKVLKKKCNIIALKNKGKFICCIEFDSKEIIQARFYQNKSMDSATQRKLYNLIYTKEKAA